MSALPVGIAALLGLLLASCADSLGRTEVVAQRDLSASALMIRLGSGDAIGARDFPIGTAPGARRCGGALGTTSTTGLPRRETLRSSIAWATDGLLANVFSPEQSYERQLRAASIRHDMCYTHGSGTYGRGQRDCDFDILADAQRLCSAVEGFGTLARCTFKAGIPYFAVASLGFTFFGDNLHNTCEYDAGINPPRDFVLAGNFTRPAFPPDPRAAMPDTPTRSGHQLVEIRPGARNGIGPQVEFRLLEISSDRLVSIGTRRLSLAAVPILQNWSAPPPAGSCLRAPCTLADLPPPGHPPELALDFGGNPQPAPWLPRQGFSGTDLLRVAPATLDVDGDGRDELVLMAIHGVQDTVAGGYGLLALALRLDAGDGEAEATAGLLRTEDELVEAMPDGRLNAGTIRRQMDVMGHGMLRGRFLPDAPHGAEQLLIATLRTAAPVGQRGSGELRMISFRVAQQTAAAPVVTPPRIDRTLFRGDGFFVVDSHCRAQSELYRRFQLAPIAWRRGDGRDGIRLLMRPAVDKPETCDPVTYPPSLKQDPELDTQDRGVWAIHYAPPMPIRPQLLAGAERTTDRQLVGRVGDRDLNVATPASVTGIEDVGRGCDALRAFSLDWLGCTHANGPDRRFVWRWSRAVNPVLPLPNSGRLAAVYLVGPDPAAAPDVARRERLRLELLPLLAPGRDDARSLIIAPATVTPRQADAPPDRPDWTLSGSWLVYPVLAARVGPSGQDGLALFRTTGTQSGRPQLELALAIAPAAALAAANPGYPPGDGAGTPVQLHWHMERWRCPLPPALAGAGADIARGAEGGADPHLRYAVTLRLERGAGQADAFAIALRRRTPDRMITSPDLAHALVLRDEAGWRTEVGACQGPLEF